MSDAADSTIHRYVLTYQGGIIDAEEELVRARLDFVTTAISRMSLFCILSLFSIHYT